MNEGRKFDKAVVVLLIAILLAGGALRFFRIGRECFWLDEMFSVTVSSAPTASGVFPELREIQPHLSPLYFYTLHFWNSIFPRTEAGVRSLSAIFGTLTIIVVFLLGSTLFDRLTGLLAAFFFAITTQNIGLAQEARPYALFTLLVCLSFLFFFRLTKRRSILDLVLYVIFSSLSLYTQNLFVFILFVQIVIFLFCRRRFLFGPLAYFLSVGVVVVTFAPWLTVFASQLRDVVTTPGVVAAKAVPAFAQLYGTDIGFVGGNSTTAAFLFLVMAAGLFRSSSTKFRWRDPILSLEGKNLIVERVFEYASLSAWMFIPVVIMYLLSVLFFPVFGPGRYTIHLSPPFYILLACGIRRWKRVGLIAIGLFVVLCALGDFSLAAIQRKPAWRELAVFLERNAADKDVVLLHRFNIFEGRYYLPVKFSLVEFDDINDLRALLKDYREDGRNGWIVFARPEDADDFRKKVADVEADLRVQIGEPQGEAFAHLAVFRFELSKRHLRAPGNPRTKPLPDAN